MGNDAITAILQSHPFAEGFWPDHIARLAAMAGETHFRPPNVALEAIRQGHPIRVALAFDADRLLHACEHDHAFGFPSLRAIPKVMPERMHAIRAQLAVVQ